MTTQAFYKHGKEQYRSLPETLQKAFDLVSKATNNGTDFESYKKNETKNRVINLAVDKFADWHAEQTTSKKQTTRSAEPKKTSTKKITSKKEKATKQMAEHHVELLPEEIKIIKRFLLFDGKFKTAKQISTLLDYVQKAIIEKRIRKTSEFAKEIEDIQHMLIKAHKVASTMEGLKTELDATKKQRFIKIVNSYEPLTSVRLIKRYISLDSKPTKEKAQKLFNDLSNFSKSAEANKNTKYNRLLQEMSTHLIKYNRSETQNLPVVEQGLNGFAFLPFVAKFGIKHGATIAKIAKPVIKQTSAPLKTNQSKGLNGVESGVMSVDDAKAMSFDKIGFTGKLKELIGDACEPTSIFIYGSGGSGKSGLSLQIADFLGSKNKSILYVAGEQFNTPTFTELLRKTGVKGTNFKIVKDLNTLPLANFDVIVIDSKDSVGLLQSYQFKELRDMYPNKIYIITSQGTKAGNFTGDEKWRNEVDTLIYCESGTASTLEDKNRWGAKASIKIY